MSTIHVGTNEASSTIENLVEGYVSKIDSQLIGRAYRVSNELANNTAIVLRGQRSGIQYNVPGTGKLTYVRKDYTEVRYNNYYKTAGLIKHKKGTAFITHKKYVASAPGEPPAVRTGAFRASWKRRVFAETTYKGTLVHAVTESDLKVGKYVLGTLLEKGTETMAPRPYKQKVIELSLPKAKRIYKEPYLR